MNTWFMFAFAFTVLVGLLHSILGEKYVITPLQHRENLPRIFGSDLLTKRTLRFAWHLTTVAWFSLASFMLKLAFQKALSMQFTVSVLFATFAVSFLISLTISRGRHFSWAIFLAISVSLLLGWLN
jgi:hypothetical protein